MPSIITFMMRRALDNGILPKKADELKVSEFKKPENTSLSDVAILRSMLANGFSIASSYTNMSRDRGYFKFNDGNGEAELLRFCSRYLKGAPIPSCPTQGQRVLAMFREAEKAGIIRVIIEKADQQFVPERLKQF